MWAHFCRKFYEKQDKLIEGYEEVQRENVDDKRQRSKELRDKTTLYAKISFVANVVSMSTDVKPIYRTEPPCMYKAPRQSYSFYGQYWLFITNKQLYIINNQYMNTLQSYLFPLFSLRLLFYFYPIIYLCLEN